MPISYYIDAARQRIYTRAEGIITYEELRTHMYSEAGEVAASFSELIDCSSATTEITQEEVRRLAAARRVIAKRQPPGPVAVVATDSVFHGVLRMYEMLTDQVRSFRVFSSAREAEQWLDELARSADATTDNVSNADD